MRCAYDLLVQYSSVYVAADVLLRESPLYPFDESQNGPRYRIVAGIKIASLSED